MNLVQIYIETKLDFTLCHPVSKCFCFMNSFCLLTICLFSMLNTSWLVTYALLLTMNFLLAISCLFACILLVKVMGC